MAFPTLVDYRYWHAYPKTAVTQAFVQPVERDVPRLAIRATRLIVLPDAFDVKLFEHVLREQFVRLFCIFLANQDFDSACEIGAEPIQPDHIVIDEEVLNARRIQNTLCDGSLDRKSTRLNSSHLGISYAVF